MARDPRGGCVLERDQRRALQPRRDLPDGLGVAGRLALDAGRPALRALGVAVAAGAIAVLALLFFFAAVWPAL